VQELRIFAAGSGALAFPKMTRPSLVQAPPRAPNGTSHSMTGTPPERPVRSSAPRAKNPMDWPSGDQKGSDAPSVPGSRRASAVSRGRIQRPVWPFTVAEKATLRPSGESASETPPLVRSSANRAPGGGLSSRRTAFCCGVVCRRRATAQPMAKPAARNAAAVRASISLGCFFGGGAGAAAVAAVSPDSRSRLWRNSRYRSRVES
jgi:hypothetical protein